VIIMSDQNNKITNLNIPDEIEIESLLGRFLPTPSADFIQGWRTHLGLLEHHLKRKIFLTLQY
jgi:hypothetical protein